MIPGDHVFFICAITYDAMFNSRPPTGKPAAAVLETFLRYLHEMLLALTQV
jgi:hypothetical protein